MKLKHKLLFGEISTQNLPTSTMADADYRGGRDCTCGDVCSFILAVILPPLGVFIKKGLRVEFWICLLLTILGYLPGIVYAVWVIATVSSFCFS